MSVRELVVLGTASQVPTRDRNHNGYLLRWGAEAVLFDPGEGTQRQMTLAGVRASAIRRICITHVHGDHCLGLPGILQRLVLDGVTHRIDVHFPAAARDKVDALRRVAPYEDAIPVRLHPEHPGTVADVPGYRLRAAALSHSLATLGWRVEEHDGWRLLPQRLDAAGVYGRDRSELLRAGTVKVAGSTVHLEDVAEPRPGQKVGFVMDTRWCDGALELAADVDLLVVEATFLESERDLADQAGHLTAREAARLAREAGARRVVLTHVSQRYPDLEGHVAEARAEAPGLDLTVAHDLDRIPVPRRP